MARVYNTVGKTYLILFPHSKYPNWLMVRSTQACDTWSIIKSLRRNIPIHTFEGISLREQIQVLQLSVSPANKKRS